MLVRSWLSSLVSRITRQSTHRQRRAAGLGGQSRHLHVEQLEDRRMMAFDPAVIYPVHPYPYDVVSADFNNDGHRDLALATYDYYGNYVSVLLGKADGTFRAAIDSSTGLSTALSLAMGDFNGDGNLDLAAVNNSGGVSVLLGNGAGGFSPTFNAIGSGIPASVAVGDFNSDGKLDLGWTSNVPSTPYGGGWEEGWANVMLGTGTGRFGAATSTWLGYVTPVSTVIGDFNSDGKADFATSAGGAILVLPGTGTGTLGAPIETWGIFGQIMAADDLNEDGRLDLVVGSGGGVSVLLGNGLGSFSGTTYGVGGVRDADVGDFNGDGRIDIAFSGGVLLGTGEAGSAAFKPHVGSVPACMAVGDFNGDGLSDVAGITDQAIALLNDGDWPPVDVPVLSITDVVVTEGNVGTVNATFTVSLSAAYSQEVSVVYATADGSANAGSDYVAKNGRLTFLPGETSKDVSIAVNGDRIYESSEYFYVRLSEALNAFVPDSSGMAWITNDEPILYVNDVSGPEGNTGTTEMKFTVTLSNPYDTEVTVDFATADLTPDDEYWYGPGARAGTDYTAVAGTVTFEIGQTEQTIKVPIIGDRLAEYDESFFVNLSNPSGALLNPSQAIGTILNDEPYVSIGNASVVEGHAGSKAMNFTVTLSAPHDEPVTVEFATADGSASAASGDYHARSGSVTFDIGQTTQTISIPVNGDRLGEGDEYFYVNLASGYYATAAGTIVDDEPRISISDVTKKEGKRNQTTQFIFTVTLSAAYDQPVTMLFRTVNDTAKTGDNDFVAKSGTLTFNPGETTKTITIVVNGDNKREGDEVFYLDLSGNGSNSLFTKNRGVGTILNDD